MAKKKTLTERVVELEKDLGSVEKRLCKVEREQTLAFEASGRNVDIRIREEYNNLFAHIQSEAHTARIQTEAVEAKLDSSRRTIRRLEMVICRLTTGHKWKILATGGSGMQVSDISVCCDFCGIKKELRMSELTRRQKRCLRKEMKL